MRLVSSLQGSSVSIPVLLVLLATLGLAAAPLTASAQIGGGQKISDTEGNFGGTLDDGDSFGKSAARIGDLNGDGTPEVAVGAWTDDDGGTDSDRGAVWILFLNDDGTVQTHQKISDTAGGFGGSLDDLDFFGTAVGAPGDVNDDGIPDLVVGASLDDDGGGSRSARGAVWVLMLDTDGTVKSEQKISDTSGSFGGSLDDTNNFGSAIAPLGDLNGDAVPDIAVGAPGDPAVWILFLNNDGTVADQQRIASATGGFTASVSVNDNFGIAADSTGDLDGNGVTDLAVGASTDGDGGTERGAVWILFLKSDGTVTAQQKISDTAGGFQGTLDNSDLFGTSLAGLGDLNGNGVPDLAVGANSDDDGGPNSGAVWLLYLDASGTVNSHAKISDTAGGFGGAIGNEDLFGDALAALDTLNNDDLPDLFVGERRDDDGNPDGRRGAAWVLFGDARILPVELARFEGRSVGEGAVQLTWATAAETQNAGFRVQHRSGGGWRMIGRVESTAPSGTTTDPQTYRFRAEDLEAGTHAFRLKQVDLDGTTTVHGPVRVEVGGKRTLRLSAPAPNPVDGRATVFVATPPARTVRLRLYDAMGRVVRTLYEGTAPDGTRQTLRLDAQGLASGVYLLRLDAGGQTTTRRVTVVR
jgi:hypothetical protein